MMTPAEIEVIHNDFRERAFWMSGVQPGILLSQFERVAKKVEKGELSYEEAQRKLREILRQQGYKPPEKGEGGMKDLSSWVRIQAVLETNKAMAHGFTNWSNHMSDPTVEGFKFFRSQGRDDPRFWAKRWKDAKDGIDDAEATPPLDMGFDRNDVVGYALKQSSIWRKLSAFGTPYPPFDFFSGMNIAPIGRDECRVHGLEPDKHKPEQEPSFNESLQVSCADGVTPKQEKAIKEFLQGTLEIKTEKNGQMTFEFTDPNGTKKGDPNKIAELISAPTPDKIPQRQAEAFKDAFATNVRLDPVKQVYLGRLLRRITPADGKVWFARPQDMAKRDQVLFVPVFNAQTKEFSIRIESEQAVSVAEVAKALAVKIITPWAIPF